MVISTKVKQSEEQKEAVRNGGQKSRNGRVRYRGDWPCDIVEAYKRHRGPYTVQNAWTVLSEERLELYNGWLVWKPMTDAEERRIAAIIQEILSSIARTYHFGQAYPDQFECLMANKSVLKPDVSVISNQRYELQVGPVKPGKKHQIMRGGPELAIELHSPSNTRAEEHKKRQKYFDNDTLIVWNVEPTKRKIWVYEVENPENPQEYGEGDTITCEKLFPGWQRQVADFFSKDLTAEDIPGQAAKEWRAESRAEGLVEGFAKGRTEGEVEALKKVLILQAQLRFEAEKLPNDLENRLVRYNLEQLTALVLSITTSVTLEDWLDSFPVVE